jgi:hypothetical protein
MLLSPSSAFAESVMTTITCATPDGQQREFGVGWDNSNAFFNGRGEIPRLYCEGGYAGIYTIYVSDALPLDDPRRWFNGVALLPEPVESSQPEPVPSIEPSLDPEPTPIPEPTQEPTPDVTPTETATPTAEPTPEATQAPEPTPEPIATPEISDTPEPEPTPEPIVSEIAPEPVIEPSPIASNLVLSEPIQESVQIVALEVPSALQNIVGIAEIFAAAEAFMNIGSDMTDEQREESQSVVVAAVLVSQLAMRKIK